MNAKFFEKYILVILLLLGFYNFFYTSYKLREATAMVEHVRTQINMVSDTLSHSQRRIGELMNYFDKNEKKIRVMKAEVEKLNINHDLNFEKQQVRRDSLKKELSLQEQAIQQLKKDLE